MTAQEMILCLRRRLELADGQQSDLLCDLLADANALILGFTNRTEMPPALERVQCALAATLYNRLGMEGERSRSEGGVSITVDTLPGDIVAQLLPYRLARVVTL